MKGWRVLANGKWFLWSEADGVHSEQEALERLATTIDPAAVVRSVEPIDIRIIMYVDQSEN